MTEFRSLGSRMRRRLNAHRDRAQLLAFLGLLEERGYAPDTAQDKFRWAERLLAWLRRRRLALVGLDARRLEEFLRSRGNRPRHGDRTALRLMAESLQANGALVASPPVVSHTATERLLRLFGEHLEQERGLAAATVAGHLDIARRFLSERHGDGRLRLRALRAGDALDFLSRYGEGRCAARVKLAAGALRGLFRFLRLRGDITIDLAASIPSVPRRPRGGVPKFLAPAEVVRLLRHCCRRTAVGRRDFAILQILARLGLRAGEVVALTLDDVDWEGGHVLVRGKGPQLSRLPLPQEVGEALAAYLRHGRPRCTTRRLFVRAHAPYTGFSRPIAVGHVVRKALQRAGLNPPSKGAHVLRHTLATQMLRRGATLFEIGQILRHSHPDTTAIYAKVDLARLQALARPWPGASR